jgi:DNA-binding MarR family transcriptional regulator
MLTMLIEVPRLDPASLAKAAGADEASGVSALRRLQTFGLVERDASQLDLRKRPVRSRTPAEDSWSTPILRCSVRRSV